MKEQLYVGHTSCILVSFLVCRLVLLKLITFLSGAGEQTTKVSWFPPPQSWEGSSYDSLEWTPKAEEVFQSVFVNARQGVFQPLSAKKWRDPLARFQESS